MFGGTYRHRSARRICARRLAWGASFLASIALFLNLLVWAQYAPAMAAGIETQICTADGGTVQPTSGKDSGAVHPGARHCPIGMLAGSLSTPPATILAPAPSPLCAERLSQPVQVIAVVARPSAWNARAPPKV